MTALRRDHAFARPIDPQKYLVILVSRVILFIMQIICQKSSSTRAAVSFLACCLLLLATLVPAHSQRVVFGFDSGVICSTDGSGSGGHEEKQGRAGDCCLFSSGICHGANLAKTDTITLLPAPTGVLIGWNIAKIGEIASRKPVYFKARGPPALL